MAVATTQDAKKHSIKGKQALAVLEGVDQLYVAKRGQVAHFDLRKQRPAPADLLAMLLGPTGNLRAPTTRKGRTLLVGFSEEVYARVVR